jgi:hypothetical protein
MLIVRDMQSSLLRYAVLTGAPLLALACGRLPLDPSGTTSVDAPDAATADVNVTPAAQLRGTWSGEVQVSAPGFAWGPFDRLTLGFNDDGTLTAMQFASNHSPPHTFGPSAPNFPLQGSRVVPLTHGSGFTVQVTVEAAEFASDHFHLRYRVVGVNTMMATTDYIDDLTGHIDNGVLDVTYSMDGTILIAPIGAKASGQLRPD